SSTPNNCSAVYQEKLALLLIQASPRPLLIAFRNPAGDLLDLVKINYKQNRSQETTETGLPSRPHFVQSE
ncbi:hypothetical protein, partial [Blautia sp.]|uniref:hypothetical protein n=1 Tax=Blautia sp. TaxID=1955243 RepID=UPI0025B92441